MSNYAKEYAEAFAIFSKYETLYDRPEFDYRSVSLFFAEALNPEDHARLIELGWKSSSDSSEDIRYWHSA